MSFMSIILYLTLIFSDSPMINVNQKSEETQRFFELNLMLDSEKFLELNQIIINPTSLQQINLHLDWLKYRWIEGSSSYVSMMYAIALWRYADYISSIKLPADAKPDDVQKLESVTSQSDALRGTAVASMLYLYGVIPIDGARCGDQTSPTHRLNQFPTIVPGLLDYMAKMSPSDQKVLIDAAIRIETKTAKRRDEVGDSTFLCSQGIDALRYGISRGTTTEAAPKPDQLGRQVDVDTRGYKPKLLDPKVWQPIADKARIDMRARLESLFAAVGAVKK